MILSTEEKIDRLVADHGLNPTFERRTALRESLGISSVTQWRHEKRLNLVPSFFMGNAAMFSTRDYLEAFVLQDKGAA